MTGALLGSPPYMAPEQARGDGNKATAATDVYALGAILYECLTGRPPFKAATVLDTLLLVVNEEPVPVRRLQPRVPRDLETICLKCLAKEPAKRYANASALAEDLRRFQAGEPVQARSASRVERSAKWARRHPAPALLLGVSLWALVALTVLSGGLVAARNEAEHKSREAEKQQKEAEKQARLAEDRRKDAETQKGLAEAEKEKAQKEAAKAQKARAFLVSIFDRSDANRLGGAMTARQILDEAERRLPREFADQPGLRDELRGDVENLYARMTANVPLAMILESSGTVRLRANRKPPRRAVAQTLLYGGDRLTLAADGRVRLIVLSDWHKERLRPGTEATVRRKGCEPSGSAVRDPYTDIMLTFVPLPRGTFYMGWNGAKESARKTAITEDFEIAVHDVTQGQWEAVMGKNPSHFSRFGGGASQIRDISDEELKLFPVESVSWDDAQEFIKKLNERGKKRGSGHMYRLPTEAEWEYSCRGGAVSETDCSYHFYFDKPTNDLSSDQANFAGNHPFGNAPKGQYLQRTTRVGAYPPNKLGLCDVHGNVWQWCADLYDPKKDSVRAGRGGSWCDDGSHCRPSFRGWNPSSHRSNLIGFRLARVPVRSPDK